ncbi:MAG: ATP-binding protein [Methanomethylovorans sp.]|uniref:ATP-binding protein n=1 Tax=Methanomethylovorans sp. TaxID=2758717 RepID=UPI0035311BDE
MPNIKIGKNALENLTIGMYSDSKIIYREYIQNAADSIDLACKNGIYNGDEKPQIEIELNSKERIVSIKDNAYGVKASDIWRKLVYIADSEKDRGVNKGFRGIGRLGGLAYCETLRFITTYPGEAIQTTMTWNAKELISMIDDPTVKDSAEDVLYKIISCSEEPCDSEAHYFIVELEHIRDENSELLDVAEVKKYISANVPVDYNSKFYLKSKIKEFISKNNLSFSEYRIFVDGEDVFKDYSHVLYEKSGECLKQYDEIDSLEFKEFKNKQNELLAWMWFGVGAFDKQIPSCNDMRGIRLRKDNIQVGDDQTLIRFFKQQRGNYYYIGELHAVHRNLIPNARRDYFNENPTRVELETEVERFFGDALHSLYIDANRAKNAYKKENLLHEIEVKYAEKEKTGFINKDEEINLKKEIDAAKKEIEQSQKEIDKLKEKSKKNPTLSKVMKSVEKNHKKTVSPKNLGNKESITTEKSSHNLNKGTPLLTDKLIHLTENERKLVGHIYTVIQDVLPPIQSSSLIQKIQDEINKK